MPQLAPLFHWAFRGISPPVFARDSFVSLWLSHAGLVAVASFAATVLGVGLAIFVTRPSGRDFRPIVNVLATVGQTFPPAAVLALAVPALGFGPRPTIVALFVYGLLPIVENAITGLDGVAAPVRDAARGMGLSSWQMLRDVELPLALPAILAGMRSAAVQVVATITLGAIFGSGGLGRYLVEGLAQRDDGMTFGGVVLVAALALVVEGAFVVLLRLIRSPGLARIQAGRPAAG